MPYFSLQAAVLVSSKQIVFSDIFRNCTFYEDTIVMIANASTDDELRDMVVSQSDLEDGQIVGVVELQINH